MGSCFLCGSEGGPAVLEENGYVGRFCECGVVYIDPMPAAGLLPPTDDLHTEEYYANSARLRLNWIRSLRPTGRLLEVGCGNGALIREAVEAGYAVSAIEPNGDCAADVSARYGIPVEPCIVEETGLPPRSFDVIFNVDLLSHFPDPVGALSVMAELADDDGLVCFEVGLFGGLPARWYGWIGRPGFPAHFWFYSEDAVRTLLGRAGLELVAIRRFWIAPSTVISTLLRRAVPRSLQRRAAPSGRARRGSAARRAYDSMHAFLRYRLGAGVHLPGPATAFVAAAPVRAG